MNSKYIRKPEEEIPDALSVSQLQTFLRCRKSWYYGYVERIKAKREAVYLSKGKLAHVGMASAWNLRDTWGPLTSTESMLTQGFRAIDLEAEGLYAEIKKADEDDYDKELEDIDALADVVNVSKAMFRRALLDFNSQDWLPVSVGDSPAIELHFAIPMRGFKFFHGFVDLVAKNLTNGQVWQIDWKFVSSLGSEEEEAYNLQNAIYSYALQKVGIQTAGSMTFRTLNKAPALPNVNKDGSISRAKIATDWETYSKFCLDNGQDPALYAEEMVPKLAGIEWTKKVQEYKSDATMQYVWKNIVQPSAYAMKSKRTKYLPTVSSMTCRTCQYAALCQAEIRGYDTDAIRGAAYVSKSSVNPEVITEEETTNE